MDFLDLEAPDHGPPRSRDRKLRIAMKTLQIKGSGLAGRPLDPVKRIRNPSNKPGIRQTNLEIRQTDSMSNGWLPGRPNPFNNVKRMGKYVKRISVKQKNQTDSCQTDSVKQIPGSVLQVPKSVKQNHC